ncbi:hypothetical protein Micbo1qcDRAFT_155494, partial [Microdochium bolleyi]
MTRIFAVGGRYGFVLVAALLVWLFIREPFARFAHDHNANSDKVVVVSNTNAIAGIQPHRQEDYPVVDSSDSLTGDDDEGGDTALAQQYGQDAAQQQLAEGPRKPKAFKPEPAPAPPIKDHFPW